MVNKSELINSIRDLGEVHEALTLFSEDDSFYGLTREECANTVHFTIELLKHIRDEK